MSKKCALGFARGSGCVKNERCFLLVAIIRINRAGKVEKGSEWHRATDQISNNKGVLQFANRARRGYIACKLCVKYKRGYRAVVKQKFDFWHFIAGIDRHTDYSLTIAGQKGNYELQAVAQ